MKIQVDASALRMIRKPNFLNADMVMVVINIF